MQNGSALKRLVEAATIQFRSPLILRSGLAIESGDAVLFAAELHQYRLQLLILRSFRMSSRISATPSDSCCGNYPAIPPNIANNNQLIPSITPSRRSHPRNCTFNVLHIISSPSGSSTFNLPISRNSLIKGI
jgi:hypothetical protein